MALRDLDVIVQEHQHLTRGSRRPKITEPGEIEGSSYVDARHAGIAFHRGQSGESRRIRAAIIDDDKIECRVGGSLQQGRDAPTQHGGVITRRHDNRDTRRAGHFVTRRARQNERIPPLRLDERTRNVQNLFAAEIEQDFARKAGFLDCFGRRRNVAARKSKPSEQQPADIGPARFKAGLQSGLKTGARSISSSQ